MNLQRTLRRAISITGVGLHSGKEATVRIRPAAPNSGVQFLRTDLAGSAPIPGHFKNVVCTKLATTLGKQGPTVSTVEHLLAALQGMMIDNVLVEIDGPEIPILDGSSLPFVRALETAGIETQLQARKTLVLRDRVELRVGEKWAVAEPAATLSIHGSVEWDHPVIGFQEYRYVQGRTVFSELAGARTFCQLKDVQAMQKMGLAQGGSLENAIVIDDAKVLNPEGLRHPNEFARHKVLDALGDFKLAGVDIQASIRLHRAGHDLHTLFLNEIFKNPANYVIISGNKPIESDELLEVLEPGYAASY